MFVFDITQGFLLTAFASVTIPALMIFLSVSLPTKVNRWTNIIIAALYIPYTLFNLSGTNWMHMVFGAVVEVVLLCIIIRYAWKWPRTETWRVGYHIKLFNDSFFIQPSIAITHRPYHTKMPDGSKQLDNIWPKFVFGEPGLHFGYNF